MTDGGKEKNQPTRFPALASRGFEVTLLCFKVKPLMLTPLLATCSSAPRFLPELLRSLTEQPSQVLRWESARRQRRSASQSELQALPSVAGTTEITLLRDAGGCSPAVPESWRRGGALLT